MSGLKEQHKLNFSRAVLIEGLCCKTVGFSMQSVTQNMPFLIHAEVYRKWLPITQFIGYELINC